MATQEQTYGPPRSAIKGTTPQQVLRDMRKLKREGRAAMEVPPEQRRLITPDERRRLELRLHRLLVWVGELTPFVFELGGRKLPLHEIVWDLLAKDCLTEEEKDQVRKLMWKLMKHEKADEEILHNSELTVAEAKKIYHEAAGLLRAIMSLKSLLGQKEFCAFRHRASQRRVEEAANWLSFLKQIT